MLFLLWVNEEDRESMDRFLVFSIFMPCDEDIHFTSSYGAMAKKYSFPVL